MTKLILALFLLVVAFRYWLRSLNLSHLKRHGHTVPPEFEGVVDPALLARMSDYTIENSRLGLLESMIDNIVLLAFLFWGYLALYDQWTSSLTPSFLWGGVVFFLVLQAAQTVLDIPFSLYRNFRIENRYGFNTMTLKLWLTDLLKSLAIGAVITTVVVLAALAIVQASPVWWWFWVWLFLLAFGIFMMYIAPYVIEPLFFKFQPLSVEGLEERIKAVMEKAGLTVSKVFQVDASRRSRHSNAYFTGIGRVKRIVLFDTLLQQMSQDEIIAVLAHEVGHWKKKHVLKRIVMTQAMAFAGLFIASRLVQGDLLPGLLGMADLSFAAKLVVLGFLLSLVLFPLTPVTSALSRKHERESDRFAEELTGMPEAMASALVKLSKENLSNLHPHPLYAKFYYSHPPVVERIRSLRTSTREIFDTDPHRYKA
jgi:STE24 endopeptidase